MNIKITADSPCDIGCELAERFNIEIIPLHILINEKEYFDGKGISSDTIYSLTEKCGRLPKTSSVSVSEYTDIFAKYRDQGYEVVHISLGSALSSCYQNACIAAENVNGVYVIDSCSLSAGSGLLVCKGAELAASGLSGKEVAKELTQLSAKTNASFIIDTLEYLHAGGRCSSLSLLGANIMGIKPSIRVNNQKKGQMTIDKKYMGKLLKCVKKYIEDEFSGMQTIDKNRIFITHSGGFSEDEIAVVKKLVESYGPWNDLQITTAGCTVCAHCGPRTIGVLYFSK